MAQQTGEALSAFDDGCDSLAVVTHDSRIRIYDVPQRRLRAECVERDHLTQRYTSLAWGPILPAFQSPSAEATEAAAAAADTKKKKRRTTIAAAAASTSPVVAVGTHSGDVLVWDTASAALRTRLRCRSGPRSSVVSVAWSPSSSSSSASSLLYACGGDGTVCVFDPTTGSDAPQQQIRAGHEASSMAILLAGSVLAAAHLTVRLHSLSTGSCTAKLSAGHAAPIVLLASPRGEGALPRVFSGSATERQVYAWDATATKGSGRTGPLQGLTAGAVPVALDAAAAPAVKATAVLAVTAAGDVDVWLLKDAAATSSAAAAKMMAPTCRISVPKGSQGVFAARFVGPRSVLVARGSATVLPRFDTVDFLDASNAPIPAVALPPADEEDSKAKKGKKKGKDAAVDVLPPHEVARMPQLENRADGDEEDGEKTKKREMTMGEMVAAAAAAEEGERETAAGGMKANSIHGVLTQAIRTNDKALLDTCLATQDPEIIAATARRLPPQFVVPFLTIAVDRLRGSPSRGLVLVAWIRACLTEHMSYLMTIPNVAETLSGLYAMVHSRLETHKTLLKLSGRLDLVLAQVAKAQASNVGAAPPLNVITEGDDGEPTALDPRTSSLLAAADLDADSEDEQVQHTRAGDDEDEDDGGLDDEDDEMAAGEMEDVADEDME